MASKSGQTISRRELFVTAGSLVAAPLLRQLEGAQIPAGPINSIEEMFRDPQVRYREQRLGLEAPWAAGGRIPGVRNPIRFSRSAVNCTRPSPQLGEHTMQVHVELEK